MTVTIDTPLIDVLNEIKTNQKELLKEITDLKVAVAKLESTPQEIKELKEEIKELRTSGRNQVWAIISLLGVAVVGTVIREFITTPKL